MGVGTFVASSAPQASLTSALAKLQTRLLEVARKLNRSGPKNQNQPGELKSNGIKAAHSLKEQSPHHTTWHTSDHESQCIHIPTPSARTRHWQRPASNTVSTTINTTTPRRTATRAARTTTTTTTATTAATTSATRTTTTPAHPGTPPPPPPPPTITTIPLPLAALTVPEATTNSSIRSSASNNYNYH